MSSDEVCRKTNGLFIIEKYKKKLIFVTVLFHTEIRFMEVKM